MNNKEEALNVFISSTIEHAKATETGDYQLGNKNYDLIVNSASYLKENQLIHELLGLFSHENASVKVWAATYALEEFEQEAKGVLEQVKSLNIPHISFSAEITLEEWNNGNLKLQW